MGVLFSSSETLAVRDLSAALTCERVQFSSHLVASCTHLGSMMGPILWTMDLKRGSSLTQKR